MIPVVVSDISRNSVYTVVDFWGMEAFRFCLLRISGEQVNSAT